MKPPLIILAGGKGTRLGELTKDIPKPMVGIDGLPFLVRLVDRYYREGFRDITICTGYKAEIIEEYLWPYPVKFLRDRIEGIPSFKYHAGPVWIVNGDTWIVKALPYSDTPGLLSFHGVFSGAKLFSKTKPSCNIDGYEFYDIGTPAGLQLFKEYFRGLKRT